jgi:hypothetical protein
MENTKKSRQNRKKYQSQFLGRKREHKDLSDNFIFNPLLKGIIQGEYGKTANLTKSLYGFDWDDQKIVKPTLHPSNFYLIKF